AELTSCFPVG
nr:RecName: Full=Toxin Tx1; Short=PpTx1 [Phoneutria pertyi]